MEFGDPKGQLRTRTEPPVWVWGRDGGGLGLQEGSGPELWGWGHGRGPGDTHWRCPLSPGAARRPAGSRECPGECHRGAGHCPKITRDKGGQRGRSQTPQTLWDSRTGVNPNTGGSRGVPNPADGTEHARLAKFPGKKILFPKREQREMPRALHTTWNRFQPLRLPCSTLAQSNQSLQFAGAGAGPIFVSTVPSSRGSGKRRGFSMAGVWGAGRSCRGRAGDTEVAPGTGGGLAVPPRGHSEGGHCWSPR